MFLFYARRNPGSFITRCYRTARPYIAARVCALHELACPAHKHEYADSHREHRAGCRVHAGKMVMPQLPTTLLREQRPRPGIADIGIGQEGRIVRVFGTQFLQRLPDGTISLELRVEEARES